MKKRWIALLMLLSLLLSGCRTGGGQEKALLPLEDAVGKAVSDREDLIAYTGEDLSDLTGILPQDYTEAVFLVGSDTLSGREVIAVRAKDENALKAAAEALKAYLSGRMQETRNYLPDAYKLQSEARVETKNLTAALFIGPNAAEETRAFLTGE
ncbi:MAG: DUF4358 domain-containing protein [Clostridia bacterium]|nr:DUF4358 domain-containing protein [Clostridia bacterium]